MYLVDCTLATPAENLALDEVLLHAVESGTAPGEVLRLWESPQPMVVVGRSSRIEQEVNVAACRAEGVPILRRSSGGAAIVAGPGCLMYAVAMRYADRAALRAIDAAHEFVLSTIAAALAPLLPGAERQGTSDLARQGRKFSGNSMRCQREAFLYHGTLVYSMPVEWIARLLHMPPRQPQYRAGRDHDEFVAGAAVEPAALRAALISAWQARKPWTDWSRDQVRELAAAKYAHPDWTASGSLRGGPTLRE